MAVLTQSIAVSPPPITTTCLSFAVRYLFFEGESPKPVLLLSIKKSKAGMLLLTDEVSISSCLALYTPVAINIAS